MRLDADWVLDAGRLFRSPFHTGRIGTAICDGMAWVKEVHSRPTGPWLNARQAAAWAKRERALGREDGSAEEGARLAYDCGVRACGCKSSTVIALANPGTYRVLPLLRSLS